MYALASVLSEDERPTNPGQCQGGEVQKLAEYIV